MSRNTEAFSREYIKPYRLKVVCTGKTAYWETFYETFKEELKTDTDQVLSLDALLLTLPVEGAVIKPEGRCG